MQLGDLISESVWSTQVAILGFSPDVKGTFHPDHKESTDKHEQTHLDTWSQQPLLPIPSSFTKDA